MTSFLCRQELGGDGDRGDPGKIVQCASWKPYSFSRGGGILVGVNRPVLQCLRSRRLEVVGEKENGRARGRNVRGPSPLASTSFQGFSPTRPTGRREVSSCTQAPPGISHFFGLEWQIPGGGVS